MIDGFGVSGVEGVFRRVCEITLSVLRQNKGSILRWVWWVWTGVGGVWGEGEGGHCRMPQSGGGCVRTAAVTVSLDVLPPCLPLT